MKWIYLKTVSFEIGAWLTGGFIFLLWSMRSKHWTVDHKNETVTVDFWGSQLLMFFTEVTEQTVATTEWYKSQRKTLTGLQNKTKHPTTENKRITEIVGSLEIILLWSVMNMVCYEHGLLWVVCYEWSVMSGLLWVVCYERVCFEWEPFWSIVMCLWVTTFKLFTVIGFSAKSSYWRWWWQLHMLQQFWSKK